MEALDMFSRADALDGLAVATPGEAESGESVVESLAAPDGVGDARSQFTKPAVVETAFSRFPLEFPKV